MKVKELIEKLKLLNNELEVVLENEQTGYAETLYGPEVGYVNNKSGCIVKIIEDAGKKPELVVYLKN